MLKTQNKSSIVISKAAFLDDMLPEPYLEYDQWDENPYWSLKNIDKTLELVKKLAAKALTEDELVSILGDSIGHDPNRTSYEPTSKEIPH